MNCTHCKYFQLFPITDDGCRHPDRPNGYIYGIPSNSTTVLKIDPSTDTVSTFSTTGGWIGGVLARCPGFEPVEEQNDVDAK